MQKLKRDVCDRKESRPLSDQPTQPALVVIGGATATGKSSLAIALAETFRTIILSADSRQIYREFDIGTAKPTLQDRSQIPHLLIDICDPTEDFTLAQYQAQAQQLIKQSRAVPPLLVGGTGLYIKSIIRGLKIPSVAPEPRLRSQLQALGQPHCHQLLTQVDPVAAQQIHPNDAVRTIRALEVFYVTGSPISSQQGENTPTYPILNLALTCDRDQLRQRIHHRTHAMIQGGLVEEVEFLGKKYGWDLPLLQTLGYREIKSYLQGDLTLEVAIAQVILHTAQFAKRQQTWFGADHSIKWLDSNDPQLLEKATAKIKDFIEQNER
jgi:tRNA dimethylallyltransferase